MCDLSFKDQLAILEEVRAMDLSEWTLLFTFGYTLDIYAYGSLRLGIDRGTGKKRISYVYKDR